MRPLDAALVISDPTFNAVLRLQMLSLSSNVAAWWPLLLCGLAGGILPWVMASNWMQRPCLTHTFVDPRLDAGVRHGSTCDHAAQGGALDAHAVAIIELCDGTSRNTMYLDTCSLAVCAGQ